MKNNKTHAGFERFKKNAASLFKNKNQLISAEEWDKKGERAWIEVTVEKLEHNVRVLQDLMPPGCSLMPAIKADAYGLGAVVLSKVLYQLGVQAFCVASLQEGIELRKKGVRGDLLILGYTDPSYAHLLKKHHLMQTIVDYEYATRLALSGFSLSVHLKVDTGMHRSGERVEHFEEFCQIFAIKNLHIAGMYTQLSCCDSLHQDDICFTENQLQSFWGLIAKLKEQGIDIPAPHLQSSYGMINYRQPDCRYVRPGLAIYGMVEEEHCFKKAPALKPIFEVKTQIALVKSIQQGERIGYGPSSCAPREMRVALLTMGYADGLPRSLSCGAGGVLVRGEYAPFVGNICMDQALIDVSDIQGVQAGDVVVLIGSCGKNTISVSDFAKKAGTIPNEVTSRLGKRVDRKYI